MALKLKEVQMPCGIKIQNPYFRLRFVSYDADKKTVHYNGEIYVSDGARQSGEVEPLPGMYLDDEFAVENAEGNLLELSYLRIKEVADTLKAQGSTMEDINNYNQQVFQQQGPDGALFNPLYFYFIGAEDC